MSYKHWKWRNDSIVNKTTREVMDDIKRSKEEFDKSLETRVVDDSELETNRNVTSERLLQRDQLIGVSRNPFFDKNDYLEDLKNESEYLRPKTTYKKHKKESI